MCKNVLHTASWCEGLHVYAAWVTDMPGLSNLYNRVGAEMEPIPLMYKKKSTSDLLHITIGYFSVLFTSTIIYCTYYSHIVPDRKGNSH